MIIQESEKNHARSSQNTDTNARQENTTGLLYVALDRIINNAKTNL